MLATGQTEPRKAPVRQGPHAGQDWSRRCESWPTAGTTTRSRSAARPGRRRTGRVGEPGNLGPGWVGFDFAAAFGKPVKMVNDAAMQALGSYEGGRMLFLGLGTGLGSALIADHVIIPLELGRPAVSTPSARWARCSGARAGERSGKKALAQGGEPRWWRR